MIFLGIAPEKILFQGLAAGNPWRAWDLGSVVCEKILFRGWQREIP